MDIVALDKYYWFILSSKQRRNILNDQRPPLPSSIVSGCHYRELEEWSKQAC